MYVASLAPAGDTQAKAVAGQVEDAVALQVRVQPQRRYGSPAAVATASTL